MPVGQSSAGSRKLNRRIAKIMRRHNITSPLVNSPCTGCIDAFKAREAAGQTGKDEQAPGPRVFGLLDVGTREPHWKCTVCGWVASLPAQKPPARQPYHLVPILRYEKPVRKHLCNPCPNSGRCDNYGWVYPEGELPPGVVPHDAKIKKDKHGRMSIVMPKTKKERSNARDHDHVQGVRQAAALPAKNDAGA